MRMSKQRILIISTKTLFALFLHISPFVGLAQGFLLTMRRFVLAMYQLRPQTGHPTVASVQCHRMLSQESNHLITGLSIHLLGRGIFYFTFFFF